MQIKLYSKSTLFNKIEQLKIFDYLLLITIIIVIKPRIRSYGYGYTTPIIKYSPVIKEYSLKIARKNKLAIVRMFIVLYDLSDQKM